MTDTELLVLCREAFEAISIADKAKKILKRLKKDMDSRDRDRRQALARVMAGMVERHLNSGVSSS
jgi:hypothetical protein